ncbi:MAG TPA: hypothetical protein VM616_07365 [Gammaproteobacteria bacterium]|nr:hypothetical protein [Gammaproteobacteria bacterium]
MSAEQASTVNIPSFFGIGVAMWVLAALFLFGAASLIYGLSNEAAQPDFRLLAVSFLYLMGVSQAGVVFVAITRLVRAQWAKPYYRLAELGSLAFFPFAIAGFLLLYFFARDDLFYWLDLGPDEHASPWLNVGWLFIRDLFALLLFYALAAIYFVKGLKPDLAGSNTDHREVERQLYLLSPFVLLAFVVCNTFFAWDFGMMLIPHWHSTVFPIHFWFGNLFAGSAALIVFPALLGRSTATGSHFGPAQIRNLGMLVTAFTLMWLYFYWAQFFVIWFGNLPHEYGPLWRQMYGHYSPYYWAMMAGCFFVPFVAFIFAVVKRSLLAMCLIAFGINLGIWINKYLMIVPAFSPDARPFDSWLDISLAVGLLAGFLAIAVFLAHRLPIYAHWEIALKPGPRR